MLRLNPLRIDAERFSVAKTIDGEILGFGQIEVFDAPAYSEVRSMFVKKDIR